MQKPVRGPGKRLRATLPPARIGVGGDAESHKERPIRWDKSRSRERRHKRASQRADSEKRSDYPSLGFRSRSGRLQLKAGRLHPNVGRPNPTCVRTRSNKTPQIHRDTTKLVEPHRNWCTRNRNWSNQSQSWSSPANPTSDRSKFESAPPRRRTHPAPQKLARPPPPRNSVQHPRDAHTECVHAEEFITSQKKCQQHAKAETCLKPTSAGTYGMRRTVLGCQSDEEVPQEGVSLSARRCASWAGAGEELCRSNWQGVQWPTLARPAPRLAEVWAEPPKARKAPFANAASTTTAPQGLHDHLV